MSLVRWNPTRELATFDDEVERFLGNFWKRQNAAAATSAVYLPPMDVEETKDHYRISAELPGMAQKDVKVTVIDDSLVIRGEKKQETDTRDRNYHRIERTYGQFERVLNLGTKVDRSQISATMKDGVLHIEVAKAPEAVEREVQVEVK